jgi:hypothetical protein
LLITLQITREYQQGEGFSDVRAKKEGKIPNLEITLRKEINAYIFSRHLLEANYQSGASGWPDRLPAEVPAPLTKNGWKIAISYACREWRFFIRRKRWLD